MPNTHERIGNSALTSTRNYLSFLHNLIASQDSIATGTELATLLWVINRSTRLGMDKVVAPVKHMSEGIYTNTGKVIQGSVGVSTKSVSRALQKLKKSGLITRVGTTMGVGVFSPNMHNISSKIHIWVYEYPDTEDEYLHTLDTTLSCMHIFPSINTQICWLWILQKSLGMGSDITPVHKNDITNGVYLDGILHQCPLSVSYKGWAMAAKWLSETGFITKTYGKQSSLHVRINYKYFIDYAQKDTNALQHKSGNVLTFNMPTRRKDCA